MIFQVAPHWWLSVQPTKPIPHPKNIHCISWILLWCSILSIHNVQGDPNQNLLFQLALSLNVGIPDPMLVKPKCVWEAEVFCENWLIFTCKWYMLKMSTSSINLHGLMVKTLTWYAKGPWFKSVTKDLR